MPIASAEFVNDLEWPEDGSGVQVLLRASPTRTLPR